MRTAGKRAKGLTENFEQRVAVGTGARSDLSGGIVFRGSRPRSDWGGYENVVTGVEQYQGWSNLRTLRLVILHSNHYNFTGAKASV